MILLAKWISEPGEVIIATGMVVFHVLGASAEAVLGTLATRDSWSLAFQAAPPESER